MDDLIKNYGKTIFKVLETNQKHYVKKTKGRINMAKTSKNASSSSRRMKPATTPEAKENQMISLAMELAEKQLMEGTASSQVITHFLKLGSTKELKEKEILDLNKQLIAAKTESLHSNRHMTELYENAMRAMKSYSGQGVQNDEPEDI